MPNTPAPKLYKLSALPETDKQAKSDKLDRYETHVKFMACIFRDIANYLVDKQFLPSDSTKKLQSMNRYYEFYWTSLREEDSNLEKNEACNLQFLQSRTLEVFLFEFLNYWEFSNSLTINFNNYMVNFQRHIEEVNQNLTEEQAKLEQFILNNPLDNLPDGMTKAKVYKYRKNQEKIIQKLEIQRDTYLEWLRELEHCLMHITHIRSVTFGIQLDHIMRILAKKEVITAPLQQKLLIEAFKFYWHFYHQLRPKLKKLIEEFLILVPAEDRGQLRDCIKVCEGFEHGFNPEGDRPLSRKVDVPNTVSNDLIAPIIIQDRSSMNVSSGKQFANMLARINEHAFLTLLKNIIPLPERANYSVSNIDATDAFELFDYMVQEQLKSFTDLTERQQYTIVSTKILKIYKFFIQSNNNPLISSLYDSFDTLLEDLKALNVAFSALIVSNPDEKAAVELIGHLTIQLAENLLNLLGKNHWAELYPMKHASVSKLITFIQILDELKKMATGPSVSLDVLRVAAETRKGEIEAELLEKKQASSSNTLPQDIPIKNMMEGRAIQRSMARLENEERQARQRQQMQALFKKTTMEDSVPESLFPEVDTNEEPKSSADKKIEDEIQALFNKALGNSSSRLCDSIRFMKEIELLATGETLEKAFFVRTHYQLSELWNKYDQKISPVISENYSEQITVLDDTDYSKSEACNTLKIQQGKAYRIAKIHVDLAEMHQPLMALIAELNEIKILYPDVQKKMNVVIIRAKQLKAQIIDDLEKCREFLLQTKLAYLDYYRWKKNQGNKRVKPTENIFLRFQEVAGKLVDALQNSAFSTESLMDEISALSTLDTLTFERLNEVCLDNQPLVSIVRKLGEDKMPVFLQSGSVIKIFKGGFLPTTEIDLKTKESMENVSHKLASYFPSQSPHISKLIQITSKVDQPHFDVLCEVEDRPNDSDFTRRSVLLRYCPAEDESDQSSARFIIEDPTGRGLSDIYNNIIHCVQGNLETTLNSPARVRGLIKAFVQDCKLDDPEDIEFVQQGGLIKALFETDESQQSQSQQSLFQLKQLYRGLCVEAYHALKIYGEGDAQYTVAAITELEWLFHKKDLDTVLPMADSLQEEEGNITTSKRLPFDYYIRKKILIALEDQRIISSGFSRDEYLLNCEDFPERLIYIFNMMRSTPQEKLEYAEKLLEQAAKNQGNKKMQFFGAGVSQDSNLEVDIQHFLRSQWIKYENAPLLVKLEGYRDNIYELIGQEVSSLYS